MKSAIRNVLWAGAGAALAWLGTHVWGDGSARAPVDRVASALDAPAAPSPVVERGGALDEPVEPEQAAEAPADRAQTAVVAPAAAANEGGTHPAGTEVVWFASKDARGVTTDIPNRRPDDAKGARPATDLLDGTRITCDFGAGSNTGMRFGDSLSVGSNTAQWQGSLMVYDLLEPSVGKARLTGTVGGAGSPTGEAKVQLIAIGSRIHFMGYLPNGTYLLTTIYDELDTMGRHVAVMSRHENAVFDYASQFLGVCY